MPGATPVTVAEPEVPWIIGVTEVTPLWVTNATSYVSPGVAVNVAVTSVFPLTHELVGAVSAGFVTPVHGSDDMLDDPCDALDAPCDELMPSADEDPPPVDDDTPCALLLEPSADDETIALLLPIDDEDPALLEAARDDDWPLLDDDPPMDELPGPDDETSTPDDDPAPLAPCDDDTPSLLDDDVVPPASAASVGGTVNRSSQPDTAMQSTGTTAWEKRMKTSRSAGA